MAGNATVTLQGANGATTYEIWLQIVSTSTSNEFVTQQVRDKMSWTPIRRAEMFIQFTALWPLATPNYQKPKHITQLGFEDIDPRDGFAKMNKFQDAIRYHQQLMVNGGTTLPMTLNYINNSDISSPLFNTLISQAPLDPMQYSGWIAQAEKQYIKFQNVFTTSYNMNIITKNVANTPLTTGTLAITYPPTASDQGQLGSNWLNIQGLNANKAKIAGIPGQ